MSFTKNVATMVSIVSGIEIIAANSNINHWYNCLFLIVGIYLLTLGLDARYEVQQ